VAVRLGDTPLVRVGVADSLDYGRRLAPECLRAARTDAHHAVADIDNPTNGLAFTYLAGLGQRARRVHTHRTTVQPPRFAQAFAISSAEALEMA
jgi:hypothetical protein